MNSEALYAGLRSRPFARGGIPRSQKEHEPGLSQLPGDLQADALLAPVTSTYFFDELSTGMTSFVNLRKSGAVVNVCRAQCSQ